MSGAGEKQERTGLVSIQAQLLLGPVSAPASAQHVPHIKQEIAQQHHAATIAK